MNPVGVDSRPGFFGGLAMPFRGIGFVVRNPGLARIWIFPVVIVLGLLFLGCGGGINLGRVLADKLAPISESGDYLQDHVSSAAHGLTQIIVTFVGWAIALLAAIVVSPVVAAPFNDVLGEEVELREIGKQPLPFSWARVKRDLGRTIRLEATKLGLYAVVVGPLALVGIFVPPLSAVASGLGFLFTAVYFALDYIDGPLTRRSVGVRRRFALIFEEPAAMFGFGLGVWFLLVIPLVNLLFMPAAVVGGTMLCIRLGLLERLGAATPPEGADETGAESAP